MVFPTQWLSRFLPGIIGIQLFVLSSISPACADQEIFRTPWSLLDHHREHIQHLSSDDEAIAFFQSIIRPSSRSSRTRAKAPTSSTNQNLSEETKEAIIMYLASLAVTGHAQELRKSLIEPTMASQPSPEIDPEASQFQWLLQQPPFQMLQSAMISYTYISSWSQTASRSLPPDNDFAKFSSYFDRTYPAWDGSPSSWTSLFQQHGQKGIEERLLEYWKAPDRDNQEQTHSSSTQHAYAQHYIEIRLLPMFKANLMTQIVQLEATAYETARKTWDDILEWQQQEQTKSAMARLCGTWKWLVHNHQNHGEHKMTMTFSPQDQSSPSLSAPSQPKPTTISIQGDTVYLKWTFPQGIQEDSLLLSNNDTHLAGTFKNSLGPHGSISGKRLSTCRS